MEPMSADPQQPDGPGRRPLPHGPADPPIRVRATPLQPEGALEHFVPRTWPLPSGPVVPPVDPGVPAAVPPGYVPGAPYPPGSSYPPGSYPPGPYQGGPSFPPGAPPPPADAVPPPYGYAGQVIWDHPGGQTWVGLDLPRGDPWGGAPLSGRDRFWVPAAHWSALLTTWIGPAVILLTTGEGNLRVREHARTSLNFEITMAVLLFLAALTLRWGVGLVLVPAVVLFWLVARLVGAFRASRGRLVRYPGCFPFVR